MLARLEQLRSTLGQLFKFVPGESDLFARDRALAPGQAIEILCDHQLAPQQHELALISLLHDIVDCEPNSRTLAEAAEQISQLEAARRQQFLKTYWLSGWDGSGRGRGLINMTSALNSHAPQFPGEVYACLSELLSSKPGDTALVTFLSDYQVRFIASDRL